ncbi:MAG: Ig-like domain-containing protein [Terracidiphilus sp.]
MIQPSFWISLALAFGLVSTQAALSQAPAGISILSPGDFSTISGTVPVIVDAHGITEDDLSVRFFLDGIAVGLLNKPPYRLNLNSTSTTDGSHMIMVVLVDRNGVEAAAMVNVVVNNTAGGETFQEYLLPQKAEVPDYGLYSYLLIPRLIGDKDAISYKRVLASIHAFSVIPPFPRLPHLRHEQINIAYIPLRRALPDVQDFADAIIEDYDYSRALDWLNNLKDQRTEGPYIVTCKRPLSNPTGPDQAEKENCVAFDLSNIPLSAIKPMVELFFRNADTQLLWGHASVKSFVIDARLALSRLAQPLMDDPTLMKPLLDVLPRK